MSKVSWILTYTWDNIFVKISEICTTSDQQNLLDPWKWKIADFFLQNSDSQQIRDISIASHYLRLKRYQMIICHVIHKSKKFWNSAKWQNHRFLRNYLIWKTKRVKNQETECKCQWRQSCKFLKMFTHQGEMLIGLKKSHFPSKFCFWQRNWNRVGN